MKKYKVMFVTLSAVLKDGSRNTLMEEEICSCKSRGMAELICYRLRENDYKELLSRNCEKMVIRISAMVLH